MQAVRRRAVGSAGGPVAVELTPGRDRAQNARMAPAQSVRPGFSRNPDLPKPTDTTRTLYERAHGLDHRLLADLFSPGAR